MTDNITLPRSVVEQALYHLNRGDADAVCWADGCIKPALEQPVARIPASVPDDWKLVPVEPTRGMLDAAHKDLVRDAEIDMMLKGIHSAMLAAAPQPPAVEQPQIDWQDMYLKEKRRAEMWVAKYEKDIGKLEVAVPVAEQQQGEQAPSPTAGMNIAQRILHVGGRNNAAGYVEFGSIQAVEALVRQVLRDLPQPKREPLNPEQIETGWDNEDVAPTDSPESLFEAGVRFAERTHGIGGEA